MYVCHCVCVCVCACIQVFSPFFPQEIMVFLSLSLSSPLQFQESCGIDSLYSFILFHTHGKISSRAKGCVELFGDIYRVIEYYSHCISCNYLQLYMEP